VIKKIALFASAWFSVAIVSHADAQSGASFAERVATAAEDARGLKLYTQIGLLDSTGARIPATQLDSVVVERAKHWIVSLQKNPVTGIQLDPLGRLALATGQDVLAQQQFDTRLATPRLSVGDRTYTLLLAATLFGQDVTHPTRMRLALRYLALLDALPVEATGAKYSAHATFARRYYLVGDGAQVRMHSHTALALIPVMPFLRRPWLDVGVTFLQLANVLSGLPDGRARIDSIGKWLMAYTQASPAQLAEDRDSTYYWYGRSYVRLLTAALHITDYLGRRAPPIQGQYWWNTTDQIPAAAGTSVNLPGTAVTKSKALNDGKIRMFEIGDHGCGACQAALPLFDRMGQSAPSNVETWYVTYSTDVWGATKCTPDETAAHLKRYYLERKQLKLKIALWIGPRIADEDGGTLREENPMKKALASMSVPTFVMTDGNGIVRHISRGFSQDVLQASLQYLINEAASSARGGGS
jgi:hypothetical protein